MAQPDPITLAERCRQAQQRVDEQRTKLQRMIVQGAPTQAAEDLLARLSAALDQMQRQRPMQHG
jgi:hypothetical protein